MKHFVFDVPATPELPYLPGQFVSITQEIDGRKITRAYSTASPACGNRFELCLNRVQDGLLSPWLFNLEPGETVEIKGPLGVFTWRSPVRDSVLVATGTGVVPFRGMLQSYLASGGSARISLVLGVRYEASLLYRDEFEESAAKYPNFRFVPVLSRPGADWAGRSGHVQEHVLVAIGERRDVDVYVCGMKTMVDDMRVRLREIGLDRKQIIFEKYD
ncbi:MAG TPA: FAD-binding oxidoreductase [Bryobacteraceae bacterium]|nr:FAD-binding oxidoreductase [Bryobacteraceae bacterium]